MKNTGREGERVQRVMTRLTTLLISTIFISASWLELAGYFFLTTSSEDKANET
jgi:hypothetical protein